MTGDTVVDAHPERCQNCKSAIKKEKVWWICRKNCVERNNIDTCIMKPVQFEPIEQPHPEQELEYIITEKELSCLQNMDQNDFVIDLLDAVRSRPHSPLTQDTTDCPHHCSVFRNGFDNNAPMEHHCDFLNNTCEVEEEKIRQDEREKVLDMIGKGIMKLSGIVPNIPQDPNDDRIPEIGIDELGYLIKSLRTKPEGT